MRRLINPLPGLTLRTALCFLGLYVSSLNTLEAQCTLQSTTQTYPITSPGTGGFSPTFSQYSPPAGYSLVAAVFSSSVTMTASFGLTNPTGSAETIKVGPTDNDEMEVYDSSLGAYNDIFDPGGDDISDETISTRPNFWQVTLPAGGSTTVGPSVPFNNKQIIYDSITTAYGILNSFQGTGNVPMQYYISSGYQVNTTVNASPTYDVATSLSLTYYYCFTGVLAVNILDFTAVKNGGQVDLAWQMADETPGRKYEVQMSSGSGGNFTSVAQLAASGFSGSASYSYPYTIAPADNGELYFRIKMTNTDGSIGYSAIKVVNVGPGGGALAFSIYPNPATDHITLTMPGGNQNWQVEIFAADGSLMQHNSYTNTSYPVVNFNRQLAIGAYFVRAVNLQTGAQYTGTFLVE